MTRAALTVDEVAAQFGVSPSHIRRMVSNKTLTRVPNMGHRVLIAVGELDRVFGVAA